MKICLLVSSMGGGGAERVAAHLCNHWVRRGYSVTLVATYSGRGDCVYLLDERVALIYLVDTIQLRGPRWLTLPFRLMALRRLLLQKKLDVAVSFLTNVNILVLFSVLFGKLKIIVSERVYPPLWPVGGVLSLARRILYPRASRVVMQTQLGLAWLEQSISAARGTVIPNPVEYPLPRSNPVLTPGELFPDSAHVVLAVGRLEEQKQFDLLLEAFSNCIEKYSDWRLVIVGVGSLEKSLLTKRDALGLQDKVFFPGRVGNISDWFERSDLLVLSSKFEGFPSVLIEAMSYGCPVISYDCPSGPGEIIRHGHDGLLVPPSEGVKGLAIAMDRLMGDKNERKRLSDAAAEVRQRFGIEFVLNQWDELFKEIGVHR
jgi:GalNAc-alpha-(1->4)-GalNAc-alpha-(1->3)-diNAcBac-PP-undecaprenol alpha-1,4-N-acetyl-D-galactosaminyltransferase